jgi:peroxiredoxin
LRELGVDMIACVTANDPFVLSHWKKSLNADHILFLSDGNLEFFKEIGMVEDRSDKFQGPRGRRFAMFVDDGVVKYLGVGEDVQNQTGIEPVLAYLRHDKEGAQYIS